MQSDPNARPSSTSEVRRQMRLLNERAMSHAQLAGLPTSIVTESATEDVLVKDPPRIVDAKWNEGTLTLTLSRAVNDNWVECMRTRMGNSGVRHGSGTRGLPL